MTGLTTGRMDDFSEAFEVSAQYAKQRLDVVLAQLMPDYSRNRVQGWIRAGRVLVDGEVLRPRDRLQGTERIEVWPKQAAPQSYAPQDISLQIVHTDTDLIIINKPAGLVMHPAPGHADGTLLNALLFHFPETAYIPRAGIVHRLDRDTTGLVAVARTEAASLSLTRQLQERTMHRQYQALVHGEMIAGQTLDAPVGRHPRSRQQWCVRHGGREAITHFRVHKRYAGMTLLDVRLETGRTHQIRVHLSHLGHPVVGDPVYGGTRRMPAGLTPELRDSVAAFRRQALHAATLKLRHPTQDQERSWEAPLPEDFQTLLELLDEQAA